MAKWPHEEVSDSGKTYPVGLYKVKVTKQEDAEDNKGRFFISINTRILEPKQFKGQPYNIRFLIGMTAETAARFDLEDEDLEATNPATWEKNPQAAHYKRMLKAAGVAPTGDTVEEGEDMKDKVFILQNNVRDEKYNDPVVFYPDNGSVTVANGKDAAGAKASPLKKSNGAAPARQAKPVEVVEETDDGSGGEDDDWE